MMFFLRLALYPVFGARVSMPRCQLPPAKLSEDEACRQPYEIMQTENERRLSDMQTTYRLVLLSRQTLPRNEVPCTILF